MWVDILWWAIMVLSAYLIGVSIFFRIWPDSAATEAIRHMWCRMTHQRWHVVQHEGDTLTRLYCTRCGQVHLTPNSTPSTKGNARHASPPESKR